MAITTLRIENICAMLTRCKKQSDEQKSLSRFVRSIAPIMAMAPTHLELMLRLLRSIAGLIIM